jgi:azurin
MDVDDSMRFPVDELHASAECSTIELTLRHHGHLPKLSMGRNWVLARGEDVLGIAFDGMAAGSVNDYLRPRRPSGCGTHGHDRL